MKRDIPKLMGESGIDAILVFGSTMSNPYMYYVTNGCVLTSGLYIQKRGEYPVLICNSMDRAEAKKSGLKIVDDAEYLDVYLKKIEETRSKFEANKAYYSKIFKDFGIAGRVAVYGRIDVNDYYQLLKSFERMGMEFVNEHDKSVLGTARLTKDSKEAKRIKAVGKKTNEIFNSVVDFIAEHETKNGRLVKKNKKPLRIRDVKEFIEHEVAKKGLQNPIGAIFSIGRDAGVPHNLGTDTDPIREGKSIVFDFFPQERGGGYFFDMTRTFWINKMSERDKKLYLDVLNAQEMVLDALEVDSEAKIYDELVSDFFENKGYPTLRKNKKTKRGYVHSVGHGLGLGIHENPFLNYLSNDKIEKGHVFTVEPGLYYPDKGVGVRVEDVVYITPRGKVKNLTTFEKESIIKC